MKMGNGWKREKKWKGEMVENEGKSEKGKWWAGNMRPIVENEEK